MFLGFYCRGGIFTLPSCVRVGNGLRRAFFNPSQAKFVKGTIVEPAVPDCGRRSGTIKTGRPDCLCLLYGGVNPVIHAGYGIRFAGYVRGVPLDRTKSVGVEWMTDHGAVPNTRFTATMQPEIIFSYRLSPGHDCPLPVPRRATALQSGQPAASH